jgi:hypothetical protein
VLYHKSVSLLVRFDFQAAEQPVGCDLKLMKKYLLCLITVVIGMVFGISCTQQQGTTSPATASTQGGTQARNPSKTRGSVEAPSPIPGGAGATAPTSGRY